MTINKFHIQASLEDTDLVENNFELNGADFLLGFDLQPLILEVNANPDMTSTTETTKQICPLVLKDLIKVVIDYKFDKNVDTGDFELLHSVPISRFHSQNIELGIDGKKVLPMKIKRKVFKVFIRNDLCVQGLPLKIPRPTKISFMTPNDPMKLFKKPQIAPLKLYKTPRKPRNIFQTIIVQPFHSNNSTYIEKLPSLLQSSNKKLNLYDLMRCFPFQKKD